MEKAVLQPKRQQFTIRFFLLFYCFACLYHDLKTHRKPRTSDTNRTLSPCTTHHGCDWRGHESPLPNIWLQIGEASSHPKQFCLASLLKMPDWTLTLHTWTSTNTRPIQIRHKPCTLHIHRHAHRHEPWTMRDITCTRKAGLSVSPSLRPNLPPDWGGKWDMMLADG